MDIYNGIMKAGTFSQDINGAGIDLGHWLELLNKFLPDQCDTKFGITGILAKYTAMFIEEQDGSPAEHYTGMTIYWKGMSSGLDSVYKSMPSSWPHHEWRDFLDLVWSKKSTIENNPKGGWCQFSTASTYSSQNFTMSAIDSSKTGSFLQIKATISNDIGESYSDYGIVGSGSSKPVDIYGSTDGRVAKKAGGDDEFDLTVQWDGYGVFLKNGATEERVFSWTTYSETDLSIAQYGKLSYWPSDTPPTQSNGKYSLDGARDATLYVQVGNDGTLDATLYAGASTDPDSPKAEVSKHFGGWVIPWSYTNTFNNMHKNNDVVLTTKFEWTDSTSVIRKQVMTGSTKSAWYVRSTAT
eukprot:UN33306